MIRSPIHAGATYLAKAAGPMCPGGLLHKPRVAATSLTRGDGPWSERLQRRESTDESGARFSPPSCVNRWLRMLLLDSLPWPGLYPSSWRVFFLTCLPFPCFLLVFERIQRITVRSFFQPCFPERSAERVPGGRIKAANMIFVLIIKR